MDKEIRIAQLEDLTKIKDMYKDIVKNMYDNNINIWDEIYPCEFLKEDIDNKRLYLVEEDNLIIAAFALCDTHEGKEHVEWESSEASAIYIDRLGVNVAYSNKGIGSYALIQASHIAKDKGVSYLRLFVVEENIPAINLYEKNGFKKAKGIYKEYIDEELILYEYGYEMNCI